MFSKIKRKDKTRFLISGTRPVLVDWSSMVYSGVLTYKYADMYPSAKEVGRGRGSMGKRRWKKGVEGSSDKDEDVMRKLVSC